MTVSRSVVGEDLAVLVSLPDSADAIRGPVVFRWCLAGVFYVCWSMDADRRPWQRQRGESAKAYSGFRRFRNLGPDRTLTGARSIGRRCSWRWRWAERARAWDAERFAREDEALLDGRPPTVLEVVAPLHDDASKSEELDLSTLLGELDRGSPWASVVRALAEER